MRIRRSILVCCVFALLVAPQIFHAEEPTNAIRLPGPRLNSDISVEAALLKRRSVRSYREAPLTLAQVSQLLWSSQGITDRRGYRTAPSAGALYPLEVYLLAGNVEGLSAGVYRYLPSRHSLQATAFGDRRNDLSAACLGQAPVKRGAAAIVISAVYERTTGKYGERGVRYVHLEAGHAAQNISLQATALGLGNVMIGAFHDKEVKKVLQASPSEQPLLVVPVGQL